MPSVLKSLTRMVRDSHERLAKNAAFSARSPACGYSCEFRHRGPAGAVHVDSPVVGQEEQEWCRGNQYTQRIEHERGHGGCKPFSVQVEEDCESPRGSGCEGWKCQVGIGHEAKCCPCGEPTPGALCSHRPQQCSAGDDADEGKRNQLKAYTAEMQVPIADCQDNRPKQSNLASESQPQEKMSCGHGGDTKECR